MKKFNVGGGIQTWTTSSGKFGLGAGPVSPITNVAAQGSGIAGLFNPYTIGAGLVYGLARNRSEKRKAERHKNENLFLLTADLMRQAGEDPYEMYPLEMFDPTQNDMMMQAYVQNAESDNPMGPYEWAEEQQREYVSRAIWNWRQRNEDLVKEAYDKFVASGLDYVDYRKRAFPSTPEGDDPSSYEVVNFPTGLEGEYTDANGTRWGFSDSTRTRWIISEDDSGGGGGGGGGAGGDCDDPVYADANPEECKVDTGGGDCDDPVYAAENPEECGGDTGGGDGDDPAYAGGDPEE